MPIGNPNGYGSIVLNAKGGVMSANSKRPGQRFISAANARAQMSPAAMQRAQRSASASIRSSGVTARSPVKTVRAPAGAGRGAVDNAVKQSKGRYVGSFKEK